MISFLLSLIAIIAGLFTGSTYRISAPTPFNQTSQILGVSTQISTPSATPIPQKIVIIPTAKPTPTPTSTPSPTPTALPALTTIVVILTPTPLSIPTPSPTLTPTPTLNPSSVNVEIKEPNNDFKFTLTITDGIDDCQLLQVANNQGKIKSLTLDSSYLATFNTLLVKEIDGYSDNWIFTVNGTSPDGCSLVHLHNNDSIIWSYLSN